jgi:hypothetical protein
MAKERAMSVPTAQELRNLAACCRALEAQTPIEEQKKEFAELAEGYDDLARRAQARERNWELPVSKKA